MKNRWKTAILSLLLYFWGMLVVAENNPTTLNEWRKSFVTPPVSSAPYVWWHWLGYNVSREGITQDLEAMKEAGIGGLTLFQVNDHATNRVPCMKNQFNSLMRFQNNEWWALLRHSLEEANRLHLEFGMHNCPGWSMTGGPWIAPENSMQKIVWTIKEVKGPAYYEIQLYQPESLCNYYKDIAVLLIPDGTPAINDIHVVSSKLNSNGLIRLEVPEGNFSIYRFGHTSTGRSPVPVPADIAHSLEADKMSERAMKLHMLNVLEPLKKEVGKHIGTTLKFLLFDSYEAGYQDWTPAMPSEFLKLKSYDIIPWLPVIAGRIVDNPLRSNQFKADFKEVVENLFARYSYELPGKMLHELNLEMHIEPYASNNVRPFNTSDITAIADIPMTEFWSHQTSLSEPSIPAAANFWNKKTVAAEAFTGSAENSRWSESLPDFKASGDIAFLAGVNRLVLHHWVHQPFSDQILPGMSMGRWGSHFGRNQIWFKESKTWIEYLTRCQFLLQKGQVPSSFLSLDKHLAGGDIVSKNALEKHVEVKNRKILSTSGREYSFLVVPAKKQITAELQNTISQIESKGAIVYYDSLPEINKVLQINSEKEINWIHKQHDDVNIFFVSNADSTAQLCTFIFKGIIGIPEIWYPSSGAIKSALYSLSKNKEISILQKLEPFQSLFFVFTSTGTDENQINSIYASNKTGMYEITQQNDKFIVSSDSVSEFILQTSDMEQLFASITSPVEYTDLSSTWQVKFHPAIGNVFNRTFKTLSYWNDTDDTSLKYFSGTAVYTKKLKLKSTPDADTDQIELDLGKVGKTAIVKVNNQYCATLWHFPYKVNITSYLQKGNNLIEIHVKNTWSNYLIGDEHKTSCASFQNELFNLKGESLGSGVDSLPNWILDSANSVPLKKKAFSSWNYFINYNQLTDSGLRGPVRISKKKWVQFNY